MCLWFSIQDKNWSMYRENLSRIVYRCIRTLVHESVAPNNNIDMSVLTRRRRLVGNHLRLSRFLLSFLLLIIFEANFSFSPGIPVALEVRPVITGLRWWWKSWWPYRQAWRRARVAMRIRVKLLLHVVHYSVVQVQDPLQSIHTCSSTNAVVIVQRQHSCASVFCCCCRRQCWNNAHWKL